MNTPTFKEQFDKITRAYFENKLEPMRPCACFIGNLLNGNYEWVLGRDIINGRLIISNYNLLNWILGFEANLFYTPEEIIRLEENFLSKVNFSDDPSEDNLFEAMDSTLDMLRKIHESKGEIIEDFEFTKRQTSIQDSSLTLLEGGSSLI